MSQASESKWYAVSSGNGNDGVSHMFPDYYVKTSEPWNLARAAMIASWVDRQWAAENCEVDGEEDYTITATVYEGPEGETQFGAAEMIIEVFPVSEEELPDQTDPWHKPMYDSLDAALDSASVALARKDSE
jgi:hypothetical protein